jgi:hypothetical protein
MKFIIIIYLITGLIITAFLIGYALGIKRKD